MNSKRKAEIQRRLSLNAVPRPPADLADRIKADIPKYLQPEPERTRFIPSFGFTMRMAASVLLVVTTAIVTIHLMTPEAKQELAATSTAAAPNVAPSAKMAQVATEEVHVDIQQAPAMRIAHADEEQPASAVMIPQPPPPAAPRVMAYATRDGGDFDAVQETQVVGSAPSNIPGGVIGGTAGNVAGSEVAGRIDAPLADALPQEREFKETAKRAEPESITVTAEAPIADDREKTRQRAAAVPAPAPPPARASNGLVREAYADSLALGPKDSVFGISVNPSEFQRIKSTIESGRRPDANSVDVDALVNYFAGAPDRAPRRGVRLEVEASPALVDADGEHAVLRFTIDTPVAQLPPRASTPPVAKDVRVTIDVNNDVVATLDRIGNRDAIAPEAILHANLSVTGLYAIELKKPLRSSTRVATVKLSYTSVEDNKPHTLEKTIRGEDLAKSWTRASRRHRLASLGALWGESLKGGPTSGVDVARRAGELASQDPKDARARELANAASVTAGER